MTEIGLLRDFLFENGFNQISCGVAEESLVSPDGRTEVRFNDIQKNPIVIIRYSATPWATPPEHWGTLARDWELHASSTTPTTMLVGAILWPVTEKVKS